MNDNNDTEEINIKIQLLIIPEVNKKINICGSTLSLGEWNTNNSLPLKQLTPSLFEIQFKENINSVIEYKYIFIDENNNIEWEKCNNHKIEVNNLIKLSDNKNEVIHHDDLIPRNGSQAVINDPWLLCIIDGLCERWTKYQVLKILYIGNE